MKISGVDTWIMGVTLLASSVPMLAQTKGANQTQSKVMVLADTSIPLVLKNTIRSHTA